MDATISRSDDTTTIRFVFTVGFEARTIWRGLTDAEELRHWFPTDVEGALEAGAALRFSFRDGEGPSFAGQVLTYEPWSVLSFSWADHTLRFELTPEWGACRVVFTDTSADATHAARDAAGWHVCLENLKARLAGLPIDTNTRERWERLLPEYVEKAA